MSLQIFGPWIRVIGILKRTRILAYQSYASALQQHYWSDPTEALAWIKIRIYVILDIQYIGKIMFKILKYLIEKRNLFLHSAPQSTSNLRKNRWNTKFLNQDPRIHLEPSPIWIHNTEFDSVLYTSTKTHDKNKKLGKFPKDDDFRTKLAILTKYIL